MRWNLKLALLRSGKLSWQVAADVGIRSDLLSKITSGAVDPKPDVKAKLSAYLSVDEEALFKDEDQTASREERGRRDSHKR